MYFQIPNRARIASSLFMLLYRQCYCFCYLFGWIFPSFPIPMSFFSADLFEPHAPPPPPLIHATKIEALQTCICHKKRKRTANYGHGGFYTNAQWRKSSMNQCFKPCAGIFKQSIGARNRVGIGLSFRPARAGIFKLLCRPRIDSTESIPPAYEASRAGTTLRQPYSYSPQRLFKYSSTGYTAWWNWFREIDSWTPYKFKNLGSANDPIPLAAFLLGIPAMDQSA
jgi:hypothetical protein